MKPRLLFLLTASLFAAGKPAGEVQFREHVIESNIPGGYSVVVTDLNKDGKPDVIGLTQRITEHEKAAWMLGSILG